MPSKEFGTLELSIVDLKSGLMDFAPSTTEPYSKNDLLKCQAFVVFAHAEMQVYWESIARRILQEAEGRWKNGSSIDRVIATLIAFRRPERASVPNDPFRPHDGGNLGKIIEEAIKSHTAAIADNNGIKRSNIAELLMPLGLLPGDFVEKLLIQLDQAGIRRGAMVHKSSKVSLPNIRDPFADEMADIDDLISEIRVFDNQIASLGLLSV